MDLRNLCPCSIYPLRSLPIPWHPLSENPSTGGPLLPYLSKPELTRPGWTLDPSWANQILSPKNLELGSGKPANCLDMLRLGHLSHHVWKKRTKQMCRKKQVRPMLPQKGTKEEPWLLATFPVLYLERPFCTFCPWASMKYPSVQPTNSR